MKRTAILIAALVLTGCNTMETRPYPYSSPLEDPVFMMGLELMRDSGPKPAPPSRYVSCWRTGMHTGCYY